MYRGSGGLLQKNHIIHKGAVDILFSKTCQKLKCNQNAEVIKENINDILHLKDELANHYSSIYFTKGTDNPKPISPNGDTYFVRKSVKHSAKNQKKIY